jgi:hypothetical protein
VRTLIVDLDCQWGHHYNLQPCDTCALLETQVASAFEKAKYEWSDLSNQTWNSTSTIDVTTAGQWGYYSNTTDAVTPNGGDIVITTDVSGTFSV